MNKRSVEAAVGIFVVIGLACVGYLTIKLGKMEVVGGNFYEVSARFGSVSGLKKGAVVEMAGVRIGKVDGIDLDEDHYARVRMKIDGNIKLTDDVSASIKTSGLIGDKYVSVEPGGSGIELARGGMIEETHSAVDIEEMIGKYAFGDVTGESEEPEFDAFSESYSSTEFEATTEPASSPVEEEL